LSSNNSLVNPKLLLDLPATPRSQHDGGELIIGPDNNLYLVVGDIGGRRNDTTKGQAQNYGEGPDADGSSGILRVTQDGRPVGKGILGNEYPLNLYYAYGIRNSFGMDFDPVTGNLWDTENGPEYGDEINLVEPGFNSGHHVVLGPAAEAFNPDDLVRFNGNGRYSDPEFSWGTSENKYSVGPTSIKFLNTNKLGSHYRNHMLVADINNGNIYHFALDSTRRELLLDEPLDDKVAVTKTELDDVVLGEGFGGISDLQLGPDGNLYVLSGMDGGTIFRVRGANSAD
jgi:glucose/arabinose dehydrogenase